jgi:type I restriction enzyme S subunit
MVPIGEVVDFIGGGTPSRDVDHYWNGDIPWASVKDFKGPSIESTLESITHEGLSASSSALIPAGHVIMPTRMALGKAAINSIDVAINQDLKALKPTARIDTRYLLHAILSRANEIQSHGKGATVQGITIERLRAIQIPLPPLEEQRRIAAILDKAGQILSSNRQADALRQHLHARLFISMLGDPRSNPIGWPRLSIEALTSDYVGGAALAPEDFVDQGTPVLHKGAIKSGGRIEVDSKKKGFVTPQTAQNYQRSLAGPGKVAVTLRDLVPSGPFIGLMADLSTIEIPEFLLAQGTYAFTVDTTKILPGYLIALVNMPTFRLVLRQNAVGSTQIHIRLPVFKSIEIPVPPIEKQHEFARIIGRISSIDVSSQARIQRIDELTRVLQSSSFSEQDI